MLAEKISITDRDIVLDAGCGVGGSSIWLAKNLGCRVVGITITPAQLEKAEILAREAGVNHLVRFYLQDFCHTTFPKNSFSVVWGLESICYAEDKRAFLQEAWRVLKEKGRLIIADGFRNRKPNSPREEHYMQKWLGGWEVPNLTYVEEFKLYLQEVRFHNITYENVTQNVLPSSRKMFTAGILLFPVSLMAHWVGLRSKLLIKNQLSAILQYPLLQRKLWLYGIYCAEK